MGRLSKFMLIDWTVVKYVSNNFNAARGLGSALSKARTPNDIWCIFGRFWSEKALSGKVFNAARATGERCKLPQRVRAEPGRQTTFGAFLAYKCFMIILIYRNKQSVANK